MGEGATPGPVKVGDETQSSTTSWAAKLLLLLLSLVFCAAGFLALDWFRTNRIRQSVGIPPTGENPCQVHDPIRDHGFKSSCSTHALWGAVWYPFFTNNLGLRDARVRVVAPVVDRPRILLLGDSVTEGMTSWQDSFAGMLTARFPQYEFLNGGVNSYSPSNYLNTARMVLNDGIDFDEVIVFIDNSDVQDEAAVYRDADAEGAVYVRAEPWVPQPFDEQRAWLASHLLLTNDLVTSVQRALVAEGYYHLTLGLFGNIFDTDRWAWTYRPVNEKQGFWAGGGTGYAPLGVEGGIRKEKLKMTLLWQLLQARGIPLSVVVYPEPALLVHDTVNSRQVRIWREWCQGKCKRFITIFPEFFAAKDQCPWYERGCWYTKYFIFGDTHYNANGNAIVTDVVGKSLESLPVTKHPPLPK